MFNVFGMISGKEIKVIDLNSEFYGTPPDILMENAGKGLSGFIDKKIKNKKKKILFFCGTGNNGGDGLVAARYLSKKYNVTIFLLAEHEDEIKTEISQKNYIKLKKTSAEILNLSSKKMIDDLLSKNEAIVDSMLGIGITGKPREPYKTIVEKINQIKEQKTVFSVDVPTGLGSELQITPHYTVTFHDVKEGMNKENSGRIKVVDIKVPEKAVSHVGPGDLSVFYPRSRKQSHKGENGVTLMIGGGPFTGAPALSALTALRTGCDLSFVASPKKAAEVISNYSPNLIVEGFESENRLTSDDIELIKPLIEKAKSVGIGPGLGSHFETEEAVRFLVEKIVKAGKSLVVDADAIKALGENPEIVKNSDTVITPHSAEFKKLTGVELPKPLEEKTDVVKKWSKKLGVTILLKGSVDIITDGKQVKYNDVHNPAMTVGGTGDVLTGITMGLLSKNMDSFHAARAAAFLNGYAGNKVFEKKSYGLLPTDIIEEIPFVLNEHL
ncbi:MAG: NAD(P)H-hydrate dehydratase [Candidatus Thermoplasmatota archaeon]